MIKKDYDETVIYSDYNIVKTQIWISWFNFVQRYSKLITYTIQQKDITTSTSYSEAITFMTQTYLNIGEARYTKYLKEEGFKELKNVFEEITEKQKIPSMKEFKIFEKITSNFMQVSGLANLDMEKTDPGKAMMEDRR